jgi:putative tryptophan/tyrosine transport system substrate-binding protein
MRRRDVVKLLTGAAIAAPYRVAAQTSAKTYRLATLAGGAPITADSPMGKILTGALAEHGYTLGQTLEIQAYGANMQPDRLPQLARDIAASKVDAVVVIGWPPTAAMKGTDVPPSSSLAPVIQSQPASLLVWRGQAAM